MKVHGIVMIKYLMKMKNKRNVYIHKMITKLKMNGEYFFCGVVNCECLVERALCYQCNYKIWICLKTHKSKSYSNFFLQTKILIIIKHHLPRASCSPARSQSNN